MNPPNLPYHLRDDAIGTKCSKCGRTTWSEFHQECRMPQPDGSRCDGRFGYPVDLLVQDPVDDFYVDDEPIAVIQEFRRRPPDFVTTAPDVNLQEAPE